MNLTSWLTLVPPTPAGSSTGWLYGLILSSLATIIAGGAIFYVREMKRKILAEAKALEVEPEVLLSEAALKFLDRVERRLRQEEAKVERLESYSRALEEELRKHGITPPPWPPLKVVGDE